jgi:hypothetical protein
MFQSLLIGNILLKDNIQIEKDLKSKFYWDGRKMKFMLHFSLKRWFWERNNF